MGANFAKSTSTVYTYISPQSGRAAAAEHCPDLKA